MAFAELHCHGDTTGLLDPAMIEELTTAGHDLGIAPDAYRAAWPARTKDAWLNLYPFAKDAPRDPLVRNFPVIACHVRRLAAQGVTYAELMLAGLLSTRPDAAGVVELVRTCRGIVDAASVGAVRVEFLVAVNYRDPERLAGQAPRILALRQAGLIRGFAIAGDEPRSSLAPVRPILDEFRAAGLGIEIHAGEWAGPESVRDALEHGRPDRLGHGLAAFHDPGLLAEIRARDIHFEFCPTSNLATGAIARIEDHPIRIARELGMNYSVSTDDPGPFGCTMASEYALLERTFGFTSEDFATIHRNALRSSFADR